MTDRIPLVNLRYKCAMTTSEKRRKPATSPADYPLGQSVGASIRFTYRRLIQELQEHLAPYDIPPGMWFFLRALWLEEGLTQRELSERAGALDAATVEQLHGMERRGLIERRRSTEDRRKVHIYLTPQGRALKREMLDIAPTVNAIATAGISPKELDVLRAVLSRIRENLAARRTARADEAKPPRRPKA